MNPIFMLSIPFSAIVVLCITLNNYIGFVTIYSPSLWVWTVGLCIFWVSQFVFFPKNNNIRKHQSKIPDIIDKIKSKKYILLNIIFLFCIVFSIFRLKSAASMDSIGSKELGEEMGVGGIVGRVANILILALPFYISSYFHWSKKLVVVLAISLFLISLGSKTWTQYAFLCSFLVCFLTGRKIKIKYVFSALIFLLCLFVLYYKLLIDIPESDKFFGFVLTILR